MKFLSIYIILALFGSAKLLAQPYEFELVGRWTNKELPDLKGQRFNDIWGWESPEGREYVILGSLDSTYFIEVTFPEHPVVRDVVAGKDTDCVHRDYKVLGSYCYGVADEGNSSLQVIDMSYLPDSVHVVYDSDEFCRRAHNIFIADDRVFLATNLHKVWGSIPMTVMGFDKGLDNPRPIHHLPRLLIDSVALFTHVHDVYARDGIAYCSNGPAGLYIYDYSDRNAGLQLVSSLTSYPDQGYNHSTWLSDDGKTLVMADETHGMRLKLIDLSDIESPEVLSTFGSNTDLGSIPHNPFILGDLCFVSYYHDGLVLFDIANPEEPEMVAQYDTYPNNKDTVYDGYEGCWGTYPFFRSGNIVASDMTHGLFIFKLKGWESPLKREQDEEQLLRAELRNDKVIVDFKAPYDGQINLAIFDSRGRLLFNEGSHFIGHRFESDVPELSSGAYVVKLETDVGTEVVKTVKAN